MKKFVLLVFFFPVATLAGELPVVGLDKNQKQMSATMSGKNMSILVRDLVTSVNTNALSVLRKKDEASTEKSYWMLRNVMVGLGLEFELGLGKLWSIKASPQFRMIYSNSTHPKYID